VGARDAAGRALRAAGTHTDVSARRAAEDALAQGERRLAMVLDATHDGYWDTDLRTGTSVVSARWNEIVGRRAGGSTVGQAEWAARVHPEDGPETARVIQAAMAGASRRFSIDYRVRCDDGSHRWVRSRGRAVEWDAGARPTRVVGTLTDVTAEKVAQARLRESEEQLRVASRLAAMGTLVAGVTHEMNNPLAGVTAGQTMALEDLEALRTSVLRGEPLSPDTLVRRLDEVRASIVDAQAGAERVARIVRELATFGRPDARRVAVRLPEVVEQALRVLPASVSRHVAVLVEDRGAPEVLGSPGPLAQVVVHLVTNAARSMPEGRRGRVVVRLGPGSRDTARLEVVDDGAGMSEEIRRRAFDPFFTTREVGQGLGLGLTVCHAIVAAHGGTIAVESEPGRGSILRVELPVAPPPRAAELA
jgi:PAS domain S-box-containing protein